MRCAVQATAAVQELKRNYVILISAKQRERNSASLRRTCTAARRQCATRRRLAPSAVALFTVSSTGTHTWLPSWKAMVAERPRFKAGTVMVAVPRLGRAGLWVQADMDVSAIAGPWPGAHK